MSSGIAIDCISISSDSISHLATMNYYTMLHVAIDFIMLSSEVMHEIIAVISERWQFYYVDVNYTRVHSPLSSALRGR